MIEELLQKRDLPPLLIKNDGTECKKADWTTRRRQLLQILSTHIYGQTPKPPIDVQGEVVAQEPKKAFAGKVNQQTIRISFTMPGGKCSFPITLLLPRHVSRAPLFVHIAFRPDIPDIYMPVEEITDHGFGLAVVCYKDIVNDNLHGDYSDGLGVLTIGDKPRATDQWGKIGMWAYGASRVMDYLLTRSDVDHAHIAVVGHSRLGKTALWCAAQDERFYMGISNDSGIGGAAIAKHSTGERVKDFLRAGSWDWFCETFKSYDGYEEAMPYDQHFVLACIAPRKICVGSAQEDAGADPVSEFLSCAAASEVYGLLGKRGLVSGDEIPNPPSTLHEGDIGYHIRTGCHYFSRYDWNRYMEFMKRKISEE